MAISTNGEHLADTAGCHFNMLTTSLVSKYLPEARIPQSALTPVRSDECGLFA
jgi:hypothetical protein